MRIDDGHHHQPARIGRACHTDAAVIARHVFEHPFDRVIGIGALVYRSIIERSPRRPLHQELSFRLELSADVLESENKAFVDQLRKRAWKAAIYIIDTIRGTI